MLSKAIGDDEIEELNQLADPQRTLMNMKPTLEIDEAQHLQSKESKYIGTFGFSHGAR
jgi:hypothetical protein